MGALVGNLDRRWVGILDGCWVATTMRLVGTEVGTALRFVELFDGDCVKG